MTTLIIARHGNTFEDGEIATYVGARTDMPLTEKGKEQAKAIGRYIKDNRLIPDVVYASTLQRTIQTAKIAVKESGISNPVFELAMFNEIDYGPDENKTKEDVLERIGEKAHRDWEEHSIIPEGWKINSGDIIRNWLDFADQASTHDDNETVLVVTSNGIARFAPHITGDFKGFHKTHPLKLATGALGIFTFENSKWLTKGWNIRP